MSSSEFINVRGTFVSDDGRDSPDEDFANNVEFFLFRPEKLKKTSPGVYDWLKKNGYIRNSPQRICSRTAIS